MTREMVSVGFQARIRRASNAVDFLDFLNPITHEIQFCKHPNTCFRILNESVRDIDRKNLEDDRKKAFQICYFLRRLCDKPEIRLENPAVLNYLKSFEEVSKKNKNI